MRFTDTRDGNVCIKRMSARQPGAGPAGAPGRGALPHRARERPRERSLTSSLLPDGIIRYLAVLLFPGIVHDRLDHVPAKAAPRQVAGEPVAEVGVLQPPQARQLLARRQI